MPTPEPQQRLLAHLQRAVDAVLAVQLDEGAARTAAIARAELAVHSLGDLLEALRHEPCVARSARAVDEERLSIH